MRQRRPLSRAPADNGRKEVLDQEGIDPYLIEKAKIVEKMFKTKMN